MLNKLEEGLFRGVRAVCTLRPAYFQIGARAPAPALHGVYHYSCELLDIKGATLCSASASL